MDRAKHISDGVGAGRAAEECATAEDASDLATSSFRSASRSAALGCLPLLESLGDQGLTTSARIRDWSTKYFLEDASPGTRKLVISV